MRKFTKNLGWLAASAALAGMAGSAVQGQQQEVEPSSADTFNIPEDVTVLADNNPNKRKATAIVNGTIITGTDVDQRVALILAANDSPDISAEEHRRLRLQVLRNLIDETLQIQEAEALEIGVTDDEVNDSYGRVVSQRRHTVEEEERYLRSVGSSSASLKRQIKGELAQDRLVRRNIAPFVNVSEEEVNELFERMQASRGTAEYRLGEIYLSANPTTRDAVAENARRIVEQLRNGGSFVGYARQFSEASTAAVGGDLGWIRLEQLQNPQLEAVAKELQPGQLVGPIEIAGGFSILYLIDKRQIGMADPRDAVLSLKQISIDFPAGISEEDFRTRAAAFSEGVTKIRGCGEAESVAASLGAQVVANDQVQVKALPEQLQPIMLELGIGQATPPFGDATGVRVLMLCGRDDPEAVAGPDAETLMAQMEDDRITKRWQRYLRDLRRDAVIEYN